MDNGNTVFAIFKRNSRSSMLERSRIFIELSSPRSTEVRRNTLLHIQSQFLVPAKKEPRLSRTSARDTKSHSINPIFPRSSERVNVTRIVIVTRNKRRRKAASLNQHDSSRLTRISRQLDENRPRRKRRARFGNGTAKRKKNNRIPVTGRAS